MCIACVLCVFVCVCVRLSMHACHYTYIVALIIISVCPLIKIKSIKFLQYIVQCSIIGMNDIYKAD